MKIAETAQKGNKIEIYKAMRQKIAETMDTSKSGRDIAALSKQLQIVVLKIEELEAEERERQDDTILDIVRRKHGEAVRDNKGRGNYCVEE